MRFSVTGVFSLIARLLEIGKQMRFSTIKALGIMFELPCRMMANGDVPVVGGIKGVVVVVGQNEDLFDSFQRSGGGFS